MFLKFIFLLYCTLFNYFAISLYGYRSYGPAPLATIIVAQWSVGHLTMTNCALMFCFNCAMGNARCYPSLIWSVLHANFAYPVIFSVLP